MKKIDMLYNEYDELKNKYINNKSINIKEDYKNKLIELDYAMSEEYEKTLETDFPMTTTLEKEEKRLLKLISFVEEKSLEQSNLINEYKKITGDTVELSYLKYTDNIKSYKERLNNVKKILSIITEIKNILNNKDNKNELKLKVVKNKLMKKELLNLLYEFCLIDNLDIKEIDLEKLIKNEVVESQEKDKIEIQKETNPIELPKKEKINLENKKEQPKQDVVISEIKVEEAKKEDNNIELKEDIVIEKQEEEKILTSMPIVDKIGSVVPVNVFESLQKTEEKLPDVVLPSNGLKDDQNDIFLDTNNLFEENEKK